MILPGGIVDAGGAVIREVGLRPLTGVVELALFDAGSGPIAGRAAQIDRLIDAAVDLPRTGGGPSELTIGDRQFLLVQIARALGHHRFWITGTCIACDAPFDACIELADFPVKPASPGYPSATVGLPQGDIRVRAPTGADQAAIAAIADPQAAVKALVTRMIEPDSGPLPVLDDVTLAAIDAAVQMISPEAAQSLATICPDCEARNEISFDIAALLVGMLSDPLDDIHEIAMAYHWTEADILALPPARRRSYLDRIDRTREMTR